MQLKEIMTDHVEVVRPDTSVQEAAAKMRDLDVGMLPVCDGERLTGTITDRDIAIRAAAKGMDVKKTTVREIQSSDVFYCYEDEDISQAAKLMEDKQVRRLMVLDRNKRLSGVVSLGDLAIKVGQDDLSGEVLKEVSEPVHA
jgi:CBS domain-containing protein